MATKVKGEAIKEGSIPLSALAPEVKDKLNNIFIIPEDFLEEQYEVPDENGYMGKVKQEYITDILENKYNKIDVGGIIGDIIIIADEFISFIIKDENYSNETKQENYVRNDIRILDGKILDYAYINQSPFVRDMASSDHSKGDIRYLFVKFVTDKGISIPEENKQLFKKNMGSFADWNAKKGEAGYIENRTHYLDIIGGETLKDISAASYIYADSKLKSHNKEYINVFEETFMKLVYEQNDDIYIENLHIGQELIKAIEGKPIYKESDGILPNTVYQFDFSYSSNVEEEIYTSSIWISIDREMDEMEDDELLEYAKEKAKESILVYNENYYGLPGKYFIKKLLDDKYLSDTVLKTIPQTLTDTDKNQALTNLGIDPVVWKYLCNPLKLGVDTVIPEELLVNNGGGLVLEISCSSYYYWNN